MQRITEKQLQAVVDRINRETNSPMATYTNTVIDGKSSYDANLGNYHLSFAYGGVSLHRMCNKGGGVQDVLRIGHVSKRELYNHCHAFLRGLDSTRTD